MMRLGIIGFGTSGSTVAAAARSTRSFQVSAICELRPDRLGTAPAGAVRHSEVGELLRPGGCDVVAVCTDTPSHVAVADLVISAGFPLLIEKPVAHERRGFEHLRSLAALRGVPCFSMMHTIYGPEVDWLREQTAALPQPTHLHCTVVLQDDHLAPSRREAAILALVDPWTDAGINAMAILASIFPFTHLDALQASLPRVAEPGDWRQGLTGRLKGDGIVVDFEALTCWAEEGRHKVTEIRNLNSSGKWRADHRQQRVCTNRQTLDLGGHVGAMANRYARMLIDAASFLRANRSNWSTAGRVHQMYLDGRAVLEATP